MNKIKQNKITFTLILTAITIIFSSLTILDEEGSWDYNELTNSSKSSNSPWLNWSLKGKVSGVVLGNKTNLK